MDYVFTNMRKLRRNAGLTRRTVGVRLFPGNKSPEQTLIDYEKGHRLIRHIGAVSLLRVAEALECGVVDIRTRMITNFRWWNPFTWRDRRWAARQRPT